MLERLSRRRAFRRQRRCGVRYASDEALGWMRLATAGMLHPGNDVLMERAIAELPTADPILEIGSFCGMSTNVLRFLLGKHGRSNSIYATDPWLFEGEPTDGAVPKTKVTLESYREHVMRQFDANIRLWSDGALPHAFRLSSDEFFERWAAGGTGKDLFGHAPPLGGPLSFVFVDGDHRHEQALRDFEHAHELLVPGGFILFDDSDRFGAFPQVYDVVLTALARGYELVDANPHHLVRKP